MLPQSQQDKSNRENINIDPNPCFRFPELTEFTEFNESYTLFIITTVN